jgi:hypothetical protein
MPIVCSLLIAAGAVLASSAGAVAQDYPARPVRVVIAFSPSGAIDIRADLSPTSSASFGARALLSKPARWQRQHQGRGLRRRQLHAALRRADAVRQFDALADHGVRSDQQLRPYHFGRTSVEVFRFQP